MSLPSECNKKKMGEGQANSAARHINQKPGQTKQAFAIYCASCRCWHVTTGR